MRALRITCTATVLLLAACGGQRLRAPLAPALEAPVLRFETALPSAVDAAGVTIVLSGRIENPNPVALEVERITWTVEALGVRVGSGQVQRRLALPPRGAAPISIDARLAWAQVPGFLTVLERQRALPFTVLGGALIAGGGARVEAPYQVAGEVVLPQLPRVALEQARVLESGVFSTTVELRMTVTNPNPFPLPTGQVACDVSIAGVPVVRGASQAAAAVPPNGSAVIAFPVQFSTVGAAAGMVSAAMGGSGEVLLQGNARWGAFAVRLESRTHLGR
jgi:LEA14-like dessication related protein